LTQITLGAEDAEKQAARWRQQPQRL